MKTYIEWQKWGEIDPMWSAATWNKRDRNGSNPWTEKEFYECGLSDWLDFKSHWEQYGLKTGTCLEIGCGAGRITKHLADYFEQVIATDVSKSMIEFSKQRLDNTNIQFILTKGIVLPLEDQTVDAVFSTHVFQHFDSVSDACLIFEECYRIMSAGGTLLIHLPIYQWPKSNTRIYQTLYKLRCIVSNFRSHYKEVLIKWGKWKPLMRTSRYEIKWIYDTLEKIGFNDIEVRVFKVQANRDIHTFVLARKDPILDNSY